MFVNSPLAQKIVSPAASKLKPKPLKPKPRAIAASPTVTDVYVPKTRPSDPRRLEKQRDESARLQTEQFRRHEATKQKLLMEREMLEEQSTSQKRERREEWRRKMEKSPFLIDLLAETERIDEEARVKKREEARKVRLLEHKKTQAKQEIIVRVLSEAAEMESIKLARHAMLEDAKRQKAKKSADGAVQRQQRDSLSKTRPERASSRDQMLSNQLQELV
eukprot:TRINITY_DN5458_c0_g1_i1.p2 TRINITY_DN5458_c0_g1~~TRINITY_DN5458_c0_g1_i1.p2  ORF type:complete len:219 (+),score=39.18 TRINITY_DN5458_c0_g1_i1:44-700(+)